jgi:hypothetical protein
MSLEFELFKAAVDLLAKAAKEAKNPEQLVEALIFQRDNPFHDLDFWTYVVRLQNTINAGLDDAMAVLDDAGEEA